MRAGARVEASRRRRTRLAAVRLSHVVKAARSRKPIAKAAGANREGKGGEEEAGKTGGRRRCRDGEV